MLKQQNKLLGALLLVLLCFVLGVVYSQQQQGTFEDDEWVLSEIDSGAATIFSESDLQTTDAASTTDDSVETAAFTQQATATTPAATKKPQTTVSSPGFFSMNNTLLNILSPSRLSKRARNAVTEFSFFAIALALVTFMAFAYSITMCIPDAIPEKEIKALEGKPKRKLNVDEVTEYIGNGRLQFILLLYSGIFAILHAAEVMIMSFLMPELERQWNLSPFQSATIGATVFVGELLGNVVWGYLSDKIGRMNTSTMSVLVAAVFGIASAFSNSYWAFLILRFFVGIGVTGDIIPYSLYAEFLPVGSRAVSLMNIQSFWSIGSIGVNLVAIIFLPRDAARVEIFGDDGWRYLLVICAIPFLFMSIVGWFLPESPRFYLVSKQYDKVQQVYEKVAYMNEKIVDFEIVYSDQTASDDARGRFSDLFKKSTLWLTIFLAIIWMFNNFTYFGISLFTPIYFSSMSSGLYDVYITTIITSLAEIPGQAIGYLTLNWVGRKLTMSFTQICGGIGFIVLLAQKPFFLMVLMVFLARGATSCCNSVMDVYTAEVYPTTIRGTAFGFLSALSRVMLVATPYLTNALSSREKLAPAVIVFSILSALGTIASFLLPIETTGRQLDDYLEEDQEEFAQKKIAEQQEAAKQLEHSPVQPQEELKA